MQRAQALLTTCENDFAHLLSLFGVPAKAFGKSNYITSINDVRNGGFNLGYSTQKDAMRVVLDSGLDITDPSLGADYLRMLFVIEVAEILMDYRNQTKSTWNRVGSDGEGLSLLIGALLYPGPYYNLSWGPRINPWLGSADRNKPQLDWVSLTESSDTNAVSYGCAILFTNYLNTQLKFDLGTVIRTDAATLEKRYDILNGAPGGYAQFTTLLNRYYPVGSTPSLPTDNPFPLLDAPNRFLWITRQVTSSAPPTNISTGKATVFLVGCGTADYTFSLDKTPQQLTCSSAGIGFGQPSFTWRINGVTVPPNGGNINPTALVTTIDPINPTNTTTKSIPVPIHCSIKSSVLSSKLTITADSVPGDIDLVIELDAVEKFASTDITTATESATLHNEKLQFEPKYYKDAAACLQNFLNHIPRKLPNFLWRYLPDPPPDWIRTIREFQALDIQLNRLAKTAPREAQALIQALASRLNLAPAAFKSLLNITNRE